MEATNIYRMDWLVHRGIEPAWCVTHAADAAPVARDNMRSAFIMSMFTLQVLPLFFYIFARLFTATLTFASRA